MTSGSQIEEIRGRLTKISLVKALLPGTMLAVVIALAARFLEVQYGAPALIFALLMGAAFAPVAQGPAFGPGIELISRSVLRVGVALLGARITLAQIAELGIFSAIMVVLAVVLTIALGLLLARIFRVSFGLGALSGGAVAICGASAALAVAASLPKGAFRDRDIIVTIALVTGLGSLAMVIYPLIGGAFTDDHRSIGFFIGASMHDVAHAVGAGYSVSSEAGDVATVVKLFRVALLLPVVMVLAAVASGPKAPEAGILRLPVPLFLIGFLVLAALNSAGLVPQPVAEVAVDASRWCLIAAVAAVGTKTNFKEIAQAGPILTLMLLAETLFIGGLVGGIVL